MNSSNPLVDWLLDSLEVDTSLFHVGRYCGCLLYTSLNAELEQYRWTNPQA